MKDLPINICRRDRLYLKGLYKKSLQTTLLWNYSMFYHHWKNLIFHFQIHIFLKLNSLGLLKAALHVPLKYMSILVFEDVWKCNGNIMVQSPRKMVLERSLILSLKLMGFMWFPYLSKSNCSSVMPVLSRFCRQHMRNGSTSILKFWRWVLRF